MYLVVSLELVFNCFPYIGTNNPNNPHWLSYFSEGLKPPTRYAFRFSVYQFSCGKHHGPSVRPGRTLLFSSALERSTWGRPQRKSGQSPQIDIYICTNIYIYNYIYDYLYIYIYIYDYLYIYIYIYIYDYLYIYIYIFNYIFSYLYIYIFTYLFIFLFIYLFMYLHIYWITFLFFYLSIYSFIFVLILLYLFVLCINWFIFLFVYI